jgi:signal transduction histidine kinase
MTPLETLPAFGMFNREREDSYWPKSQCVDRGKLRKLLPMESMSAPASQLGAAKSENPPLQVPWSERERATRLALAGELVSAVTHDLRQPLTAIEMNLSAALVFLSGNEPRTDRAIEALEDIFSQQRRMSEALQALEDLVVCREPRHERCDLTALAREAIALIRADPSKRETAIELSVESQTPSVSGDATLIRQALLNVLLHAIDGGGGAGPIRGSITNLEHSVEAVVTYPKPPDGPATNTGPGLTLARAVAAAHGATIKIDESSESTVRVETTWPAYAG